MKKKYIYTLPTHYEGVMWEALIDFPWNDHRKYAVDGCNPKYRKPVIPCVAVLSPAGCALGAFTLAIVSVTRQSQLTENSQSQRKGRLNRLAVCCPESCQGFGCGVSVRGARAVTLVQCRIKRKKIR